MTGILDLDLLGLVRKKPLKGLGDEHMVIDAWTRIVYLVLLRVETSTYDQFWVSKDVKVQMRSIYWMCQLYPLQNLSKIWSKHLYHAVNGHAIRTCNHPPSPFHLSDSLRRTKPPFLAVPLQRYQTPNASPLSHQKPPRLPTSRPLTSASPRPDYGKPQQSPS